MPRSIYDENLLDNDYIELSLEREQAEWDNADEIFESRREDEFLND